MPCYQIQFKHSAMAPDYIGKAIKHAHTEDDAFACLATKGGRYDKKNGKILDKNRNTLTILDIKTL